jgi:hypothetical protein
MQPNQTVNCIMAFWAMAIGIGVIVERIVSLTSED